MTQCCPRCDADPADFSAAVVCPDPWHQILENAAEAAGEKARMEALAAGHSLPAARAIGIRRRRDMLDGSAR